LLIFLAAQGLQSQDRGNRGQRGNGKGPGGGFKITVKGNLLDESTNMPLAYATISLFLSQVEIRAEKSETQFSLDKKIFNVGKDLAGRGGSAEEILDNVPSVAVDIEGNVSLRGSGNVKILIDGRPSGLVGGGNSNGLRQLPANMIDKVEVITNPSAKYEADGMAGIINIIAQGKPFRI